MSEVRFTTRRYPYQRIDAKIVLDEQAADHVAMDDAASAAPLPDGPRRLVLGLDPEPDGRLLRAQELQTLGDPFARRVLPRSPPPLSLMGVLDAIAAASGDEALPEQQVFMVAEGGQIPWNDATALLDRGLRVVVARLRNGDARLLVSTTFPFDAETDAAFLQVIGWDDPAGVFNFYERRRERWFWAGDSRHALSEPTRGRGPFDSHVNGAVVMKELRLPWPHWHSMSQSIPFEAFGPDNPLERAPLLQTRAGAETLERGIVVPGIERWTRRRFDNMLAQAGEVRHVTHAMRQVLTTTTVNLFASPELLAVKQDDESIIVPIDFFLDKEGLLDELGLVPDAGVVRVLVRHYKKMLQRYEVAIRDRRQNFSRAGDLPFAFAVPGRAFEDTVVLREMIGRRLLSQRFAATVLMVDFANPIGSPVRASLMRFVPDVVDADGPHPVETAIVRSLRAAAPLTPPGSTVRALLADLALNDWQTVFSQRLTAYMQNVHARAATEEGVDDFFRLLDSRRRVFRRRPIAEFDLTLPSSNIPASEPELMMTPDGTVTTRPPSAGA